MLFVLPTCAPGMSGGQGTIWDAGAYWMIIPCAKQWHYHEIVKLLFKTNHISRVDNITIGGSQSTGITIILLKSVAVSKLQVAITARSSQEMSQTVRIG